MPVQFVQRGRVRTDVQASQPRIDPVLMHFAGWKESDSAGTTDYAAAGIALLKGPFDDKGDARIPMCML
jgi:hypothetical protein